MPSHRRIQGARVPTGLWSPWPQFTWIHPEFHHPPAFTVGVGLGERRRALSTDIRPEYWVPRSGREVVHMSPGEPRGAAGSQQAAGAATRGQQPGPRGGLAHPKAGE